MANNTIWIIVPVYNAEKTLKKCVRSVQKQTYSDWKLVLVDDGSKDKSGRMCDRFAKKDSRIIALHQQNAGPGAARKAGIALTENGYCCFLDSDDTLPSQALEKLYRQAKENDADIVCGQWQRMIRNIKMSSGEPSPCFRHPRCYTHEEIMSELYSSCFGITNFPVSLWAKIYRSSLLKSVMLEECISPKKFAEDWDVILRVMPKAEKISVINDIVYNYRIGGGTSGFMDSFLEDSLIAYDKKKIYSPLYTGKEDLWKVTVIDLKNVVMTYLTMCERFQKFSTGTLADEFEYVLSLPQVKEILPFLGEGADEKALAKNDFSTIEAIVKERASAINRREKIKKLLLGK